MSIHVFYFPSFSLPTPWALWVLWIIRIPSRERYRHEKEYPHFRRAPASSLRVAGCVFLLYPLSELFCSVTYCCSTKRRSLLLLTGVPSSLLTQGMWQKLHSGGWGGQMVSWSAGKGPCCQAWQQPEFDPRTQVMEGENLFTHPTPNTHICSKQFPKRWCFVTPGLRT